jgi:general secretion pathway protein I
MPIDRASRRRASAGFTLIEAVVALAITAVSLAAIGALMAGNIRGSGKIAERARCLATLRAVETYLPDRADLAPGTLSGEMHGQAWSVDIAPFAIDVVNPRAAQLWTPETIMITAQSPSGGLLQLNTVRLVKTAGHQ